MRSSAFQGVSTTYEQIEIPVEEEIVQVEKLVHVPYPVEKVVEKVVQVCEFQGR